MLSIQHNFVFIHIPKTGGNSIQTVIEPFTEDLRFRDIPEHDLFNRFAVAGPITGNKHWGAAEYIEQIGLERFMQLKRVAFVRHPLDRAMSLYFSPHRWARRQARPEPMPYHLDKDEFAKLMRKMRSATSYLSYKGELLRFDFLGRFERFDDDFKKMLAVCELPPHEGKVPHYNVGYTAKLAYCDREVIQMVNERFAEDFVNFGYAFQ